MMLHLTTDFQKFKKIYDIFCQVILNVRDPKRWYQSVKNSIRRQAFRKFKIEATCHIIIINSMDQSRSLKLTDPCILASDFVGFPIKVYSAKLNLYLYQCLLISPIFWHIFNSLCFRLLYSISFKLELSLLILIFLFLLLKFGTSRYNLD